MLSLHRTVRFKFLIIAIVIEVTMLGLLITNNLRLLKTSYNQQINTRVEELTSLLDAAISARLFERDHASVNEILNDLVKERYGGFQYIVIFDDQYELFAKAGSVESSFLPLMDKNLQDSLTDLVYDSASPLTLSGERIGQVRYGISLISLIASRNSILKQSLFIAAAEVLLTCLLLGITGFFLTRHIHHLLKATEIISSGDYTHRIPVHSKDEIGLLGESFNNMTVQLKRTIDEKDTIAEQLQRKARDLENQKFALDEHAIVSILNQQGRITYVNDKFCQISQYDREEILGEKYNFLYCVTGMGKKCSEIWETVQKGLVWQGEIKTKKKDGGDYWVETSIVPFLNEQGVPYQHVSIQTDITTTRESETLLRKQYALANTITGLQESFITKADSLLFETMLTDLRVLTQSCCGFIGEIRNSGNKPCLKIQASKNINWNGRDPKCMEIDESNPLFNMVAVNQQLIIVNDVTAHHYSDYFPRPTERFENFIMMPFVRGDHTVGVLGLVNRIEGFNSELVEFLEPLVATCTNIIEAYKNVERREAAEHALKVANEDLELRVKERTGELVETNRHLEDSKSRITAIMENVADGIITFDENAKIESFNRAAEQIFGYDAAEAIGRNIAYLTHDHGVSHLDDNIWHIRTHAAQNDEVTAKRKDGSLFPLELSVRQISLDDRHLSIAIVRDITERKAMIEHLQHLADHDTLTGLFNRNYFRQELDRLVEQIKRSKERQSALFYIDLDNFKYVNDTLGHAAGDNVLKDVTVILRNRTRKADLLCRLGGDEFTVIIYNTNEEQARSIAESFRQEMQSYGYDTGKQKIDVGCSIGIALITQESKSAESILAHADYACYQAKRAGRNCVRVFNDADAANISTLSTDIGWSQKIKHAIENDRFVFHYQPVVSTHTQQVETYEVLIRMVDENGQLIMPGGFLPAAERFSLAPLIDQWVIEHALDVLKIKQKENPGLRFAVNLSSNSLASDKLVSYISGALQRTKIDPQCVTFEITETAVIEDLTAAESCIKEIRNLGCKTALDDFGSGFASFACLQQLSIDILKIDGRFIRNLNKSSSDVKVVKAMCEMGHALDLLVTAEFVENEQIFSSLKQIGVDYAQGYYLGRPALEIPTKLSKQNIA